MRLRTVFPILPLTFLLAAPTQAATMGYWVDSQGSVVKDAVGGCVQGIHGQDFPECHGAGAMPAPVPAPISDSDGDGIPDDRDRCPGTPSGASVDSRGCVPVSDSDGDGIPDKQDRCPGTPQGASVDSRGCVPVSDSDGDGIADPQDLCADTPRGAKVNASGCIDKLVVQNLVFASNTAELQAESKAQLAPLVTKIKGNPAIRGMTITGHTDDRGSAAYNQQLSEQRAQAVRNYFIEQGVDGNTISAIGKGESTPIADNNTASGRQQNRRVEIDFEMNE